MRSCCYFTMNHVLMTFIFMLLVQVGVLADDSSCLSALHASILVPSGLSSVWNSSLLASPCNTPSSSQLRGIGCNNNRVFSITLNSSQLSGTIPASITDCSYLQSFDLSSNQLSQSLPNNIGNLTYLTYFNVSNNLLSGSIPVQLSACIYLNFLDLHSNQLSGPIPGQIGLLQRLKYFDVSNNQLSGQIPTSLSNTTTGAPRFNISSFVGNKDLYGYPLPPPTSHSLSVLAIVGIGLGSGLLSLIVSFTAVCIWLRVSEQGFAAQEGKIWQLMSES